MTNSETLNGRAHRAIAKTCQNCSNEFMIEPEDFQFYEKMEVPPPTFCPECRMVRRMISYPNILSRLYKRRCDATGKELISIYAPDVPFPVYERNYWYSDEWDPLTYGTKYDFNTPFFVQFKDLQRRVPRYHTYNRNSVNCEYCAAVTDSKDCYLSTGFSLENCCYVHGGLENRNCFDSWFSGKSDHCYELYNTSDCFKVALAEHSNNCIESAYLYNCSNCNNCIGCVSLRNKQYYILNEPYSKKEYERKLRELDLGSKKKREEFSKRFDELRMRLPRRYANIFNSVDSTGENISHTKNCQLCFETDGVENSRFVLFAGLDLTDTYDAYDAGNKSSLMYEVAGTGINVARAKFSNWVIEGSDIQYTDLCVNSSNVFGCAGLRNKQYCILNKQYTKEEYEELIPKIIQHMNDMPYTDSKGRVYKYGEFFPAELSPFTYNETIAQEYFPLTKEAAKQQGYRWRKPDKKDYTITKQPEELPDHIKDVDDSILQDIIGCEHKGGCNEQCTVAFKLIQRELQFYKKMNLPLPRICPNCRHRGRVSQRNPLKLWHRQCMCNYEVYKNDSKHQHHPEGRCPNEFETSYAPDRKEIVYCEKCYQAEVV